MDKCKQCGCTDKDCKQCIEAQGHPCSWAEPNLCSRCFRENAIGKCDKCKSTIEWFKGTENFPGIRHEDNCIILATKTTGGL